MTEEIDQLPKIAIRPVSERLNQECFCITLDRDALCQALEREVGDPDFCATFIKTRPHLFSNAPLFISESETSESHLDLGTADPLRLGQQRIQEGAARVRIHLNKFGSCRGKMKVVAIDDAVVVTPNPRVHALYADKRNLALLSDHAALRSWRLPPQVLTDLAGVPRTVLVTSDNPQQLWEARKTLFFKPAAGHGSKAVYRGDKVTKGVWAEIVRGGYVAQEFAAPGERMIKLDGRPERRKTDVWLYTYGGRVLLTAARLYQGQTTNFRTPGGGFAPVVAI